MQNSGYFAAFLFLLKPSAKAHHQKKKKKNNAAQRSTLAKQHTNNAIRQQQKRNAVVQSQLTANSVVYLASQESPLLSKHHESEHISLLRILFPAQVSVPKYLFQFKILLAVDMRRCFKGIMNLIFFDQTAWHVKYSGASPWLRCPTRRISN